MPFLHKYLLLQKIAASGFPWRREIYILNILAFIYISQTWVTVMTLKTVHKWLCMFYEFRFIPFKDFKEYLIEMSEDLSIN